jgi:Rieske Fe-S protein
MGGVIKIRAALHVEDTQLQLIEYDANGERQMRLYSEVVFPTDVMVAYFETTESVAVYLRRSPHGGCLILWDSEENRFDDPCFGSKFDRNGRYISGPSPRNLDQLTASIRDGIVWVRADVIYGEFHP